MLEQERMIAGLLELVAVSMSTIRMPG
jgi:hypothetical protein